MSKVLNETLISRRSLLGTACAVAIASTGLLTGCDGDKATVSKKSKSSSDDSAKTEEQDTKDLAVGTTVDLSSGLSVTVDSVETGLTNYDGNEVTGIHVTYVNNGDEGASFNVFDWKGEDANGAQQDNTYYDGAQDSLDSGTLAAGGTVAGNIYFDGSIVKALYFDNVFDKSAAADWKLQ